MDLSQLSSNWKKLQQTLQSTAQPPKRKASDELAHARPNALKRRKPDAQSNGPRVLKQARLGPKAQKVMDDEDMDGAAPPSSFPADENGKVNEGLSPTALAGKYVALDCEMVGVGPNPSETSAVARVSMVNFHGEQLYDSYVRPKERVTDFRTAVSGIAPAHLRAARPFEDVQADVAALLDGRVLVGHAVHHDLEVLWLGHPRRDVRDTGRHPAFRKLAMGRAPALKTLAREVLGLDIQVGEHSSVEDARACMLLFRREKEAFEREHVKKWGPSRPRVQEDQAGGKGGDVGENSGKKKSTKKKKKKKKGKK